MNSHPSPSVRRLAVIALVGVGAFLTIGAVFDLASDLGHQLPSDHTATFKALVGTSWGVARAVPHSAAPYVTRVEAAYAVYELLFGFAFLVLVFITVRRHERWAWWGCWLALGEFAGFAGLFGTHASGNIVAAIVAAAITGSALLVLRPGLTGERTGSTPETAPAAR